MSRVTVLTAVPSLLHEGAAAEVLSMNEHRKQSALLPAGFRDFASIGCSTSLPQLPGAAEEARLVAELLTAEGYEVVEAPSESPALDVINKLFRKPYRIIHIAGHGVFEDGGGGRPSRSGVVLSDGRFLTAAEIAQLEIVPDIVFLNCCFLGKVDSEPVAYNRLAYSIARELIEIGVRAVVVAGWAVDDSAARTFARTFYSGLLRDGLPFGVAVHRARRQTFDEHPDSNTWGAYQAYGDPEYTMDPANRYTERTAGRKMVAVEELLDKLTALRLDHTRVLETRRAYSAGRCEREIKKLLQASDPAWRSTSEVQFALGQLYGDLGNFKKGCEAYIAAIAADDAEGRVPILAIEHLANLETRLGHKERDIEMVRKGICRLESLIASEMGCYSPALGSKKIALSSRNAKRCTLLGGAYKRLAVFYGDAAQRSAFEETLRTSVMWYRLAETGIDTSIELVDINPYPILNRLQLQAVLGETESGAAIIARRCGDAARARFVSSCDYWDAVMSADAELTALLLEGKLADSIPSVIKCYREAREGVAERAGAFDSVIAQIRLLSDFFEIREKVEAGPAVSSPEWQGLLNVLQGLTTDG